MNLSKNYAFLIIVLVQLFIALVAVNVCKSKSKQAVMYVIILLLSGAFAGLTFLVYKNSELNTDDESDPQNNYTESKPQEKMTVDNLNKAIDESEHELVMVYADWCGACKSAKNTLKGVKGIKMVNVDDKEAMAKLPEKDAVEYLPTFICHGKMITGAGEDLLDKLGNLLNDA